jgi:hypothetical protein
MLAVTALWMLMKGMFLCEDTEITIEGILQRMVCFLLSAPNKLVSIFQLPHVN